LDSDKNFCLEHRIICKDGTSKWILDRGMVMSRDLVGAPLRMVGTFSDITNLKEVEFKMNQASKLISMGEMAAGLAHEVNNPLTIIAASLKFLTKFKDDPENFAASIQKIQKNTDRISKIIKGLKKFSRISEENNYLNCSLDIIVKEALSLTESKAKLENTIVTYDLQENLYIFCDEIGIEQVLINLINNAIDAIKNSENRWVKIQLSSDTNSVILRIIDSGSGIPEKISLKLFDPFFTTKVVGEGTGLGLSITKGILDKHNATICVLPNEKNTCFEIRFQKTEVTNVT
jgi:C4-dicarboxylate-specific signal transduction histidine kinase